MRLPVGVTSRGRGPAQASVTQCLNLGWTGRLVCFCQPWPEERERPGRRWTYPACPQASPRAPWSRPHQASPVYRPQTPTARRTGLLPGGRPARFPSASGGGEGPLVTAPGPQLDRPLRLLPLAGRQDNATCGSRARGGEGGRWGCRLQLNKGAGGSDGRWAAESSAPRPGPFPAYGLL